MKERWPKARLAEVLRQVSEPHQVDASREYPNLGIFSFGRGLFGKRPISGATSSATTLYRVRNGQFIYSRLFAFEGAYGLVTDEFDGCFVSNEYPTFQADSARLLPEFLAAHFRQPIVWEEIAKRTTGMGHRRQRVKPEAFLEYEMPLPSLSEQHRVVARIKGVATQTEEVRQVREAEAHDLRQLLLAAFIRITKNATRRPMREVAPLVRRPIAVDASESYLELGIRSFGKGTFHKPAVSGLEIGSKRIFHILPGDLLFSNVFAWEGAIAVARAEDAGRVGSHRFITCVPTAGVATARILCFFFLTDEGMDLIRAASPGGAGRNRTLGLAALEAISVPVPSIKDQNWFDSLQEEVASLNSLQQQTSAELDALMPAILNRAFRGEL